MTKQEILDAINNVIVTNNQKGITAESLANILTEIVNATPEGGSGGAGGEYIDVRYTDMETMDELLPEAQEHNVGVYERIWTALENGGAMPSLSINLDGTAVFASSLIGTSGVILALFSFPAMGEFTNMPIASIDGTQFNVIGTHLTLVEVYLKIDGTIEIHLPGMED